ncbi:MAG TPA: glycosyltransferase family 39 protein [Candidatus Limnocylindria bacterium]|nr:glycosyltransferase family 39 protein [Candidatus Limnocylindria bacterium]
MKHAARPVDPGAKRRERIWVAVILAIHLALVLWGAARNSVTFDENFHLPAGVLVVARGYTAASIAQPPLVKTLCALPALAAGARLPADSSVAWGAEAAVGESFMRRNADRYHRVFFAGRLAVVVMSVLLGLLVWRFARRLYGGPAGLLALASWALLPETLAHAGVVGMDLPTGLVFVATVYAFWRFARTGTGRDWTLTALAVAAAALTRFSAVQLAPMLVILAVWGTLARRVRRPRRLWLGLVLLPLVALAALVVGYPGHTTLDPLGSSAFLSESFQSFARSHPSWRLPLPDPYLGGLDYLAYLTELHKPSYLLGQLHREQVWHYFPVAAAVKWPLGLFALALARLALTSASRRAPRSAWHEAFLLVPIAVVVGFAIVSDLAYGVRYLYPVLPFLCIWCGGLLAHPAKLGFGRAGTRRARMRGRHAVATAALAVLALETATTAPHYLSFFNLAAGGAGRQDRIVNDSNVDWGQGLIALREELARRGIARIHLAYHGTTDPALYGIDYVPYRGGPVGLESDWIAISSYYFVGLSSPMMTREGRQPFIELDFERLWGRTPEARPAGCMYLFRLR